MKDKRYRITVEYLGYVSAKNKKEANHKFIEDLFSTNKKFVKINDASIEQLPF